MSNSYLSYTSQCCLCSKVFTGSKMQSICNICIHANAQRAAPIAEGFVLMPRKMTIMNNTIPPMTDPLGQHWKQPEAKLMEIDDTHALINERVFQSLAEYSSSLPGGVYPGKMWKRHNGAHDPRCPAENKEWLLCWYGECDDPKKCSVNFRKILLV